jgi:hypothetical protein
MEVQKAPLHIHSLTREAPPVQEISLWSIWHFYGFIYTNTLSHPLSTDFGVYDLSRDGSHPTSLGHQTMDITQFNTIGQNMRYPSVVNSRASSLGLTADHDVNDLRREVFNLRRQKQELEKQKFVRDVQLSTLQYVFLPLVTVAILK